MDGRGVSSIVSTPSEVGKGRWVVWRISVVFDSSGGIYYRVCLTASTINRMHRHEAIQVVLSPEREGERGMYSPYCDYCWSIYCVVRFRQSVSSRANSVVQLQTSKSDSLCLCCRIGFHLRGLRESDFDEFDRGSSCCGEILWETRCNQLPCIFSSEACARRK